MKIGFIGLGHMGSAMAAHLLQAGYTLTVHDRQRAAADNLVASGARWAESPRAVAAEADTIITSLPGPREVEDVLLGDGGVLAAAQSGATCIDMSTNAPPLIRRIAAAGAAQQIHVLDAPVTGAVDGARSGTLTIFVGGEQEVFDRHLPVFQAMGKTVLFVGTHGMGNVVKLVTNLLWFINAVAIGEGLVLGAKAGVEQSVLWEAIKSSAGDSWVARHDVPSIFHGDYDPSFNLDLCCKDLGLITDLGRDTGVPLELGALVEQAFLRARAQYGGSLGEMHVVKLLEDATATRLRVDAP